MRVFRAALSAFLVLFLVLSPRYLQKALSENPASNLFSRPPVTWYGILEVWHIADVRTYQGSVTKLLRERCEAFAAQHPGVHVEVTGLTRKMFDDRIARGLFPDAYSFAGGALYAERFRAIEPELPALAGNLAPAGVDGAVYAVPYLASGYYLLVNEQLLLKSGGELPEAADAAFLQSALDGGGLSIPPILGAQLGLSGTSAELSDFLGGKTLAAVVDARAYGDIVRDTDANLLLAVLPFGPYTDEVFYLGAAKDTDDHRAALIAELVAFLLAEETQQRVAALGALPAAESVSGMAYGEEALERLYAACRSPLAPDPFLYERHAAALAAEGAAAMAGDAHAAQSFSERMAVVLGDGTWYNDQYDENG